VHLSLFTTTGCRSFSLLFAGATSLIIFVGFCLANFVETFAPGVIERSERLFANLAEDRIAGCLIRFDTSHQARVAESVPTRREALVQLILLELSEANAALIRAKLALPHLLLTFFSHSFQIR